MIGHNWPVYFGFKGGKGALTGAAVLFMFDWVMALICVGVFVLIVAVTRYVSLGTISAAILFLAISFVPAFGHTFYFQIFACLMALIIIVKHRANIQQAAPSGAESKLALAVCSRCPVGRPEKLNVERHAPVSRHLAHHGGPRAAHLVQPRPVAVAHVPDQIADNARELGGAFRGFPGKL